MDTDLTRYALFQNDTIVSLSLLPQQGYCNVNYLALTQNNRYLVRKLQPNHIDRAFEYRVQVKAYQRAIAAKPFHFDLQNHLIISAFLEGVHKHKLTPRQLRVLAVTLQKLHKIKLRKARYTLKKDFSSHDAKAHKALRQVGHMPKDLVLTHHDLNPKNILFHKNKVKFIDWEYTGINDRYFDLAAIASEFKLSAKEERYFLQRYFKNKPYHLKKLRLYKKLYDILCAKWFKAQNISIH